MATHGGPAAVGTRLVHRRCRPGTAHDRSPGRDAQGASTTPRSWEPPASGPDDLGVRSAIVVPIFMSTRLWGVLAVTSPDGPLPAEAEQRLEEFAGLVTAALANAQARSEVQTLAEEQAALLRVAERVARGDPPEEVFATVAAEAQRLLGGQPMTLTRFEEDAALVVISRSGGPAPPGTRISYGSDTLPDRVRRTASAVRVNDYSVEPDAGLARDFGLVAAVAAPIVVEGRVWGMLTATSSVGPLSGGVEDRLQRFANLVGTAVSNATSHAQLVASRARVLSTADETRRRLQRDVHDGAQQRLVQTVISLKLAGQSLADGDVPGARERVAEGLKHAQRATDELRELVSGILPSTLTRKGLTGGVESLIGDLPLPVDATIDVPRLSPEIETTAYFVVAEALTNVVKHARAERAWVVAAVDGGVLRIAVRDDGVGGARLGQGSGLTGLFDRVEARGGTLQISSPQGEGTTIEASVPVGGPARVWAAPVPDALVRIQCQDTRVPVLRTYVSTARTRRCSVLATPMSSLRKMAVTCFSTAASLIASVVATPMFDLPSAITARTARSRGVRSRSGSSRRSRPSIRCTTAASRAVPPFATRRIALTNVSTSPTRSLSR